MASTSNQDRERAAEPGGQARRRGRPSPDQTEKITRLILSAALDVFSTATFDEASIEAIAARAGVKKDTIYKRFPDKRALLRAVLSERVSSSATASKMMEMEGESLEDRLKSYAVNLLRHATSAEGRLWIRMIHEAWPGSDEVEERRRAIGYDQAVRLIADEIRTAKAKQGKPVRDPEFVATALMAMLNGWTTTTGLSENVSPEEITRLAHAAIDLISGGRRNW